MLRGKRCPVFQGARPESHYVHDSFAARLIPLSARDTGGLRQLCKSYKEFLEQCSDEVFPTFVENLRCSRSLFEQRTFVVASNRGEAIEALAVLSFDTEAVPSDSPKIGWIFSGQGGEHRGMGQALYAHEPLFKAELESFDPVCQEIFGAPIASLLFDPLSNHAIEWDIARSQPLTFALQVAMARLLLSNGNPPAALLGHSLGEYAAACMAGVFSAEQGFKIVAQRSRLLESLGDVGAMLVLSADQQCAQELIDKVGTSLSIAALNSLGNTVVSGTLEAIDQLQQLANNAGVNATRLNISRPGHSYLLDPLLDRFEAYLSEVKFAAPVAPLISTVSGTLAGEEVATAQYWRRQLRDTVNFRAALATAQDLRCTHLVEIGPRATLSGLVLSDVPADLSVLVMARGGQHDHRQYLRLLGELFKAGADLCFPVRQQRAPVLDSLPTYPFQRVRCWIDICEPIQPLAESTYHTAWKPLPLTSLGNQAGDARKVLFLAPDQGLKPADISYLESAFEEFRWVALSGLGGFGNESSTVIETSIETALDGLWRKYPDGLDRVYLDLRYVLGSDISSAVATCAYVMQLLRSIRVTFQERPQLCILFSSPGVCSEQLVLQPSASSVVGMLRSVLIEDPSWKISVLQFMREQLPHYDQQASAIQLLPLTNEEVIIVKQSQAFVPRLERIVINTDSDLSLAKDLSYILLGGGGGIGQQLIECLCADQVRAIHVIGRSMEPSGALREIMRRYPNVHYLSLDLARAQGQEDCVRWLQVATLGHVAIFNLAVDLNDSLYTAVQATDLHRSFAAKCASVLHLYQLLVNQGVSIELVFNFSSATSILGNGGQSTYGAATAFLDAAHGVLFPCAAKVLTVNWGVWSDAGKLRDDQQRQQVLKASGLNSHSSEQALRFIKQLLAGPSRAVAFMNIQPQVLSELSPARARFLEGVTAGHEKQAPTRPASLAEQLLCMDSPHHSTRF